ncbi:MAG: cupin domain-containing protein [Acidobacteria bacterium]|nr:cupin domain-containing protein [Acidobacteriota bacterium]
MPPDEKKSLEQFDAELAKHQLRGQWKADELLVQTIGGPKPAGSPYVWKWSAVHPLLLEACNVLPESFTARRHLGFMNPALERGGATHTIRMGLQMVRPGEIAWAHRHTIAALRFVVAGSKQAYTVVDGEVCPMENYDLILTPQWSWHDHHNKSGENIIWLDVLDASLIAALNATFYEPYGEKRQQAKRSGEGDYVPEQAGARQPPLRYPWSETEKLLQKMAHLEGSAYDGLSLEYVNPMTGGPALPTLGCWVQMLRPGESTQAHRHISSAVYFVVRGEGETVVGDERLEWNRHDSFAVPNWSWHRHINRSKTDAAILFSVNDTPVFQALGLYREEPENSLQQAAAPLTPTPLGRK